MTALVERPATPARTATLRRLAGLEARRYARHPLFLVGAALIVASMITDWNGVSAEDATGNGNYAPAFFLGLLGVFVGHQLTRSMARTGQAVDASPADRVTRTAALCLACLVPAALGLVWVGWMYSAIVALPVADSAAVSGTDRAAIVGTAAVYAAGGPLVGVLVGRWTRFPGAGLVAAVVLVAWSVLGGISEGMPASRLSNLVALNTPFTLWTTSGGADSVRGGSPLWYLGYIVLLCGLAATAAMLHEARGAQRSRLVRVLGLLTVLALACLALAVVSNPARIPL